MWDNAFIEKIEFKEDFLPFKWPKKDEDWKLIEKGDEIFFWGKKEMQDLIEFYLKGKCVGNYKKNSERFKINCVLGNNWGGKSRLFEWLLNDFIKLENKETQYVSYGSLNKIKVINGIHKGSQYISLEPLLDDFFKLSWNINNSINKNVLNEENYNKFYCDVYNFLNKSRTSKILFSNFLNLEKNYEYYLKTLHNSGNSTDELCKFFWWKYISFSEEKYSEDNKGDIYILLESSDWKEIFRLFNFLYLKLNNKLGEEYCNLSNLYSDEDCKNIWFALSDFFIALINNLSDNLMDFTISSENIDFVWYRWYKHFKQGIVLLEFFLKLVEKNNLEKKYFKEEYSKDELSDFKAYKSIPLYKKDWKNLCDNTTHILKVFNYLEDWNEEETKNYLSNNFDWLWLNKFLMRSSGYEKDRATNASDYYILEILSGFTWNGEDINRLYGVNFRNFIYYWVRSNYSQKLDIDKEFIIKNNILFSEKERLILSFPLFNLDIEFSDWKTTKSFNNLSAGEKTMLTRFTKIYIDIITKYNNWNWKTDFIILIDEPDLHLHLDWQKKYIQKLIDVFSTLDQKIKLHFIIATHSPFIISDLPSESIILLDKKEWEKYTEIKNYDWNKQKKDEKLKTKTFWANYVDIIRDWFFFKDEALMWGFAESIIWNIAEKERNEILETKESKEKGFKQAFKVWKKLKENIWDDFLKDNLLYFKGKNND